MMKFFLAAALSSLAIPCSAVAGADGLMSMEAYDAAHQNDFDSPVQVASTSSPAVVSRTSQSSAPIYNDRWPGRGFAFAGYVVQSDIRTCAWVYADDGPQTTQQRFCDAALQRQAGESHQQASGNPMVNRPQRELYVHRDAQNTYVAEADSNRPSFWQLVAGSAVASTVDALAYRVAGGGGCWQCRTTPLQAWADPGGVEAQTWRPRAGCSDWYDRRCH